jgi:hypothetical protein
MVGLMTEPPSASALALAEALRDEAVAARIRSRVHRISLARYVRGERRPSVDTARLLELVTDGRVPMAGWASDVGDARSNTSTGRRRS